LVDLIEALSPEPDEVAVLSVLLDRPAHDEPVLRHATLLIVPARCGQVAWGNWQTEQGRANLGFCPEGAPARFLHEAQQWTAGRTVVSLEDARRWMRDVAGAADGQPSLHGELGSLVPELGELPPFRAALRLPAAMHRIFPGADTPSANFIASTARPCHGFIWRSEQRPGLLIPSEWELARKSVLVPTLCLLGINVPTDGVPQAASPPFGLLVGRMERRAWLAEIRGDGKFDRLHVGLHWDPHRVDLADLAIELEQRLDGEVVSRARFPLEALADINDVKALGKCSVSLPTIGRGAAFEVALSTRQHEFVDRAGPHPLLERVTVTVVAEGSCGQTFSIGDAVGAPMIPEHLERMAQLDDDLKALLRQGAENRILEDRRHAQERLKAELHGARGELLVHDPYFGQDVREWDLLRDVQVPVRVLTCKIAKEKPNIAAHVHARFRPKAPMHERMYLWEGGGLSLGGSPTIFGNAPVSISRLDAASADAWRERFTPLWESEHFRDVPRDGESADPQGTDDRPQRARPENSSRKRDDG
jgi:hypothetical protein